MARSAAFLRLAMRLAPGAITLLVWAPAMAQTAEVAPRVVYEAPLISIEARGVPLPVLLREIGRKVGFEVVWAEVPRPPISFEIHGAPVEEVLRQLLRSEDHVIVYGNKEGTPRVDSIVLRGPHGPAEPTLATASRDPGRNAIVPPEGAGMPPAVAEPPVTLSPAPVAVIGRPPAEAVAAVPPPFVDFDQMGVQNLLEIQALPGLKRAPSAGVPAPPAAPPSDVAEALAQTTRAARQNLKGLMESLDAATESMRATGAIAPR